MKTSIPWTMFGFPRDEIPVFCFASSDIPRGNPKHPSWGKRKRSKQRSIELRKQKSQKNAEFWHNELWRSAGVIAEECEQLTGLSWEERAACLKRHAKHMFKLAKNAEHAHEVCLRHIQTKSK